MTMNKPTDALASPLYRVVMRERHLMERRRQV